MVKQSSIKTFWITFFALLALVAIATAVFLGLDGTAKMQNMRMSVVTDENYYKISQENTYKRALYSACDSLKNLDAVLGKAAISHDKATQAQLLTFAVLHANEVNQDLSNLPIADSDNFSACQKFVNQTQDYAQYLLKRVASGKDLSEKERRALSNLDDVATRLYDVMQKYAESDSAMFITNGNGLHNSGALSDTFGELKENTFQYEKLIYDGPYSDSVQQKCYKCGKVITAEKGSEIVSKLFGKNEFAQKIENKGVWYSYKLSNGRVLLTCDGKVAEYETYRNDTPSDTLSQEQCIASAEEFCRKLGYDVEGVWVSRTQEQTTYVNCATVKEGVIVYPDLVKVAVDSYTGEVVGCEAKAYLINHRDWDVSMGKSDEKQAQSLVDSSLKVTHVAKALVEKNGEYFACYQFQCEKDSRQYFVYIDSRTGNEVEIFKVIENTEGYTVM